jgi:hypothetical protein
MQLWTLVGLHLLFCLPYGFVTIYGKEKEIL